MNQVLPGDRGPLNHTMKSRQRILVGLSWDAREDKVGLMGRIMKSDSQHDLDISCYIYNQSGELLDYVGAEAQDSMDESGKIYHSGDDMSGAGEGDDESISLELADLPRNIYSIVFMVDVRSEHLFADIEAPYLRVADGMTNENLLELHINADEAAEKNAFVACSIYRNPGSPTGWMIHNVSEYPDTEQIEDWGTYLAEFTD